MISVFTYLCSKRRIPKTQYVIKKKGDFYRKKYDYYNAKLEYDNAVKLDPLCVTYWIDGLEVLIERRFYTDAKQSEIMIRLTHRWLRQIIAITIQLPS